MDNHVTMLCREYIRMVDDMRSGYYSTEEIRQLDSDRILLHEELCKIMQQPHDDGMYQHAKNILHLARLAGSTSQDFEEEDHA